MNKEIAFVMPYFGSFKPSFSLWMESVRRNPEICWMVFTDNDQPDYVPENVIWKKTSLKMVQYDAERKLNCPVDLTRPYKLCDLKPLYGTIFSDYLVDYSYWGYGDYDVLYGELYDYLKKINYQQYDKVNRWGHCTLIKNTAEMNALPFTQESLEVFDTYEMLRNGERNFGFDEISHNEMCWKAGASVYVDAFCADIDIFYERMRCVDRRTMEKFCRVKNVTYAPTNYPKQLFVSDHGRIVRLFPKGKKVLQEEFAYIHYRQEAPIELSDLAADSFIVSRYGFFDCDEDKLDDYNYVQSLIKQYNSQTVMFTERITGTGFGKWLTNAYQNNSLLQSVWRKIKG